MKKHTKIYLDYFSFDRCDFIPCEVCGNPATDIHHIDARGMGGSKTKDYIENLQALCRGCHIEYGDITDGTTNWVQLTKDFPYNKIRGMKMVAENINSLNSHLFRAKVTWEVEVDFCGI